MRIIPETKTPHYPAPVALADSVRVEGAHQIQAHSHDRAQLIHSREGRLVVEIGSRAWLVTPQTALWIPAGSVHTVTACESVHYVSLFVDDKVAQGISNKVQSVLMQPLLQQLALSAAEFSLTIEADSTEARIIEVILDQLRAIESCELVLPLPIDKRLEHEVAKLIRQPTRSQAVQAIAKKANMSVRTLERVFKKETAMSFKQWRCRLLVLRAIELLRLAYPVKVVALELGYQSTSAFISMFKSIMNETPAAYTAGLAKEAIS